MNAAGDAYIEWKNWDDAGFGKYTAPEAVYFAAETSISARRPVCVLEIGFGNGAFLGWAKQLGAEVFGVEINPELNARARSHFAADHFFASLEDPRIAQIMGRATHIVAFDVIEHIDIRDLPALLARARDLLSADGQLIVRFPNGDSPFGRIVQHGDVTHITTLGQHKLRFLAKNAGLQLAVIRAPALPLRGVGVRGAVKRALVRCARHLIDRVCSVLYFGGQHIPLDSNYVAVLRRAQDAAR